MTARGGRASSRRTRVEGAVSGAAPGLAAVPPVVAALLGGAIDYAGTYPPASHLLDEALTHYASVRTGPAAWLLGRLVLPAAAVPLLDGMLASHADDTSPWPVTVILGEDPFADAAMVLDTPLTRATVASVEFRPRSTESIGLVTEALPSGTQVYVEVPPGAALDAWLERISAAGARAKFRTGGTSAELFPTPEAAAHWLVACVRHGVRAKATAGLHHALSGEYPVTYAAASPTAPMLGFLNLLAAAAALIGGATPDDAGGLLGRGEAPRLDAEGTVLQWGAVRITSDAARDARVRLIDGFGACSITEPAEELDRLGLTGLAGPG